MADSFQTGRQGSAETLVELYKTVPSCVLLRGGFPMSRFFSKLSRIEQDLKWAKIWFGKLAEFHQVARQPDWHFTSDGVIAFLRSRRDAGIPAWKRMKIIEGLIAYCRCVQDREPWFLRPLQSRMEEIILIERRQGNRTEQIDASLSQLDPRESELSKSFAEHLKKRHEDKDRTLLRCKS